MQETLLEHATRGERARIARELHDVVAHHISMIAVQSEIARLATPGMPTEGAERLAAIGDTARTALNEMRRLLGLLREDAGAEPTREPQPGLEQLNQLIDQAREAGGASTRLIVRGGIAPLSPGIELTAYRIVQEALTNARRHAPGAAVDVELHYLDDVLRLRVRDNGPGPPGHRLRGRRRTPHRRGGRMSAQPGIRIVVVDNQEVVRAGFGMLLDTQPDFTVVGSAADGAEAVRVCRQHRPDTVTRRLITEFARLRPRSSPGPDALAALTPRETEVLRPVAGGLSNLEIATRLVVSEETVKPHVRRILAKLGLRDRTQAVVMAYGSGLAVPGGLV
jgi:DNA-binding CsgD family transcriptional regulator